MTCIWSETFDGQWSTGCGRLYEFTHEGPRENGAMFCLYCGGKLEPVSIDDAFMGTEPGDTDE